MFQPQPAAAQRRHRRLPSGTMVSYAEVKNYLSKREIPQLFESLMAGLMYHRPENHIGYLQTCLDEVKTNSDAKVHWSTFVNKKRKSKEILPPLTPPKKQESFSSSWSDNSRQSTPLPPISAKTRRVKSRDLKNTYILYHNPPPVLAKPRVPVVSVLGGLGSRIDELCEKVVGRLSGVVHISTCSMLKTRMTIEGFYRVTSVPACAVVDSVLQAMSMVQSASALLVAGFPRSRGDIEEYRSRRVRMDGVVLVDFEEEALRRFLKNEVSSGAIRTGDIESELERYKQDIISVAEYYDEKDILTVVMGDQDTEEMIEDMVMAVDKIIETRKHIQDEESTLDVVTNHDCGDDGPCKSLVPSPNGTERPSTVEIRDATEEDIKSIEAASRNSKEDMEVDGEASIKDISNEDSHQSDNSKPNDDVSSTKDTVDPETVEETEVGKNDSIERRQSTVPILFSFENIKTDCETLKDLIVNEMGMCYINFYELVRSDGDKDDRLDTDDSLNLLQSVLQRDSVSYASGFFISDFPFDLLKESKFESILKQGDISFVCKVREKSFETEIDENCQKEDLLLKSPMSEQVRIIFVTESNIVDELKASLQEIVKQTEFSEKNIEKPNNLENGTEISNSAHEVHLENKNISIGNEDPIQNNGERDIKEIGSEMNTSQNNDDKKEESGEINKLSNDDKEIEENVEQENQESVKDDDGLTSRDENEESTCQDIEDIITDDTLDEAMKPLDISQSEDTVDVSQKQSEMENTLSQVSETGIMSLDVYKEKPVLERQQNLDVETTSTSDSTTQLVKDPESKGENMEKDDVQSETEGRIKLIRQETFVSSHGTIHESDETKSDSESLGEINKTKSDGIKDQDANDEVQSETVEKGQDSENELTEEADNIKVATEEVTDVETNTKTANSDECENGKLVAEENQEISEEIKEISDKNVTDEDNNKNRSEEDIKGNGTIKDDADNERNVSSIETSTDGDSENSQIEVSKQELMKKVISCFSDKGSSADEENSSKSEKKSEAKDIIEDAKSNTEENNDKEITACEENVANETHENDGDEIDVSKQELMKKVVSCFSDKGSSADEENSSKSEKKSEATDIIEDAKSNTEENNDKEITACEENVANETHENDGDEIEVSKQELMKKVVSCFSDKGSSADEENSSKSEKKSEATDIIEDAKSNIEENNDKEITACEENVANETHENDGDAIEVSKQELMKKVVSCFSDKGSSADEENSSKSEKKSEANDIIEDAKSNTEENNDKEITACEENVANETHENDGDEIEVSKQELMKKVVSCFSDKGSSADEENSSKSEKKSEAKDIIEDAINNTEENSDKEITAVKVTDTEKNIIKSVDNDSDSNDENGDKSITIETHAEVHAPDSESPPLIQETESPEETNVVEETGDVHAMDGDEETQSIQDTDEIQETKSLPDQEAEIGNVQETQTIEEESGTIQEACQLLPENNPAVVENENFIIVDTDVIEEESDLLDCEIDSETSQTLEESRMHKQITSETTEESQVTTIQEMEVITSERYSAKIQERNGSGILGESRQEDHSGTDEPQERSSSSSRGEL